MSPGPTFPSVLTAARAGADWAWAAIYDALSPPLAGYLRARGAVEPNDVLGEVLLQMVRDLHRFEGDEDDFRAWAFAIAHHRLLDERRRRGRRPAEPTADVEPSCAGADAAEEALGRIGAERILRVLASLSCDQREVVLLRVIGDLTVEQVARIVRRSPGAVKQLQRRGLLAARRSLEREGVTL